MTMNFLRMLVFFTLAAALVGCQAAPEPTPEPTPTPAPWERPGWELVWQDEFEGTEINRQNWVNETGGGGWGNFELQNYTTRPENVRVEDGFLIIEARQEETGASSYTSARMKTQGLQTFLYGRIEARIQIPRGQGIWPAFWMLGDDFATTGWPASGEIDIMENVGKNPYHLYGTLHGPGYSGGNGVGGEYLSPTPLADDFHVYAIEWYPGEIRWYIDEINYNIITTTDVPGQWVYDHPFFLILNVAVGGQWPGSPDDTTVFPQQMRVDYVRVYRSTEPLSGPSVGGEMHIAAMTLETLSAGEERQGQITVQVINQDGQPVEGARVSGGWLGVVRNGDTELLTDAAGQATFLSEKTTRAGEISFCVTSIVGGGHIYDKSANAQTCVFGEK